MTAMWCTYLLLLALAMGPALQLVTGTSPGSMDHELERRRRQSSDPCSVESYFQQNPNLTPECVMRINATLSLEFADALREGFCDPTCSPSYLDYINTCFGIQGPPLVEYYVLHCGSLNSGEYCYSFLNQVDSVVLAPLTGACASALLDPSTCTTQCTQAVRNARNIFGCCLNNLFNTTYFRQVEPTQTLAVTYRFWDGCGVETLRYCPVDAAFSQYVSSAIASNTETRGGGNHGMKMAAFDKLLYGLILCGVLMVTAAMM